MTLSIGQPGHVCFRLLSPNIIGSVEVPVERDPRTNEPTAFVTEHRIDGTIDSGETACHLAQVVGVNEDGTVNASGFNARGDPRRWVGVQIGREPIPVTEPGREDPAGHTFHPAAACPWGR
jgi:hypothetical protein